MLVPGGCSMTLGAMRRVVWISGLLLAAACEGKGDDDGGDSGSDTGAGCNCLNGAYVPVCGVDGMTYDATCGVECVAVEIECMSECPCGTSSEGSSGMTSDASSSGSATTAAETTMGVDPCDCPSGAYFPVCGVDGMTYDATCGIECVEAEILCVGFECPCPEIACGDALMCGATEPVCTISTGGAEPVTNYMCGPLPAACEGVVPPTCECVVEGGCDCVEDPVGYFTVTCNLP